MAQHTRLPWTVASSDAAMVLHPFEGGDAASGGIIVHTAPKKGTLLVPRTEAEANAAFIVKAVNAHDDLVAALHLLNRCLLPVVMGLTEADMVEEPAPDSAVVLHFMGSGASDLVTAGEVREALAQSRAALAKAEG